MDNMISNCSLCEEKTMHIIGDDETKMMQCIHCGYVSTQSFIGDMETNEAYKKLTTEMQSWSKEDNGRIWIPSIMTLPIGMLYPIDKDDEMKWSFAEMKDIPKEEQKNYPDGNGGFYERMYDTDNAIIYDEFFEGMLVVNNLMKLAAEKQNEQETPKPQKLKLPKLKKG
jgi:Zn ribbon nucleic-acid-binding protein